MKIKSEHLLIAARKSSAWLVSQQTEKGNLKGREEPDENEIYPDTDDLGCYYKSCYFLRIAGESIAASKGLKYVVERFMTPDGDFINSPTVRSSGSWSPRFCQLYPNAWLLRAAVAFQWIGLSQKILRFLLRHRDLTTGGFYESVTPSTSVVDSCSTGIGTWCCLMCGELDLAVKSGDFLLKMFAAQPDSTKLYTRWKSGEGLLTDTSYVLDIDKQWHFIDAKLPKQPYWVWAWPMDAFIGLYDCTGEERFLKGAIKIYDFFTSCHPHAFHFTTAGKSGWGSSMLYRITSDKRYFRTALSQMEFILSTQHKDGYILGPGVKNIEEQATRTTYDLTADFSTWLVDVCIEIARME